MDIEELKYSIPEDKLPAIAVCGPFGAVYDKVDIIPFDKIEEFFKANLK